jgi:hypothetical protein
MATLSLTFAAGTVPTSVSLVSLVGTPSATTTLPVAFTGPVTLGDGTNEWTATFAGNAALYVYIVSAVISSVTYTFSSTVPGDATIASGEIIDQNTLTTFLGALNLAIQSQQDNTATAVNVAALQQIINAAEARVKSRLAQLFMIPLTVNGVAVKSAVGSVALPILQACAHEFAGFLLNKWRAIQSMSEGTPSTAIEALANAWEKDADDNLNQIVRFVWDYSDGTYVDLDFAPGVSVGVIPKVVAAPVYAGACVDHQGYPERKIIGPLTPWWAGALPANPWSWPVSE